MPTYEYECTKCGHTFEAIQSIKDKPLSSARVQERGAPCDLRRPGRHLQGSGTIPPTTRRAPSSATATVTQRTRTSPPH